MKHKTLHVCKFLLGVGILVVLMAIYTVIITWLVTAAINDVPMSLWHITGLIVLIVGSYPALGLGIVGAALLKLPVSEFYSDTNAQQFIVQGSDGTAFVGDIAGMLHHLSGHGGGTVTIPVSVIDKTPTVIRAFAASGVLEFYEFSTAISGDLVLKVRHKQQGETK